MAIERVDQRLLGREIAVDRARGDTGLGCDLGHRDAVETAGLKELKRRVQQPVALVLGRRLRIALTDVQTGQFSLPIMNERSFI